MIQRVNGEDKVAILLLETLLCFIFERDRGENGKVKVKSSGEIINQYFEGSFPTR